MDIVYGPFESSRFGHSMGINLLGAQKVCSYNCIYCDLGPSILTMNKIRKSYEFPTLDQVQVSFREYIRKSVPIETILVSGKGEPTLHPDFDDAIKLILELRDEHLPKRKVIVLSNAAHLDGKKVVTGMNLADERVIKIDAGNDAFLQKVNDPLIRLNMAKFLSGIPKLKDCIVQAMFFNGDVSNISAEHVEDWIEVLGMVKPKHVQICTITRPAGASLKAVEEDDLYSIAFKLKKRTGLEATVFAAQKS